MRNVFSFLLFIVFFNISYAQHENHEITIYVTNISSDDGQLIIKLYYSKEHYRKTPVLTKTSSIKDGTSTITFSNIINGIYAFAIIHDENTNGTLDFNFLGIPSENLASSNNAKGFMGPPDFEDAKFEVKGKSVVQNISM